MGKREQCELMSRLAVLLAHLIKWQAQPQRCCNSYKYTIKKQKLRLSELLQESPSLKNTFAEKINQAYEHALLIVLGETDLNEQAFPNQCSFSEEQILGQDFFSG